MKNQFKRLNKNLFSRIAALDIGMDNLAAIVSNQPGTKPFLVNGRPLKSINQYYNQERARLLSDSS
ncbi:MAG: hypothetical protein U0Y68_06075 [Blastocatellia bacterium]